MAAKAPLDQEEPVIAGPFNTFDGSIIFEFLKPKKSRNASVLLRTTFKHDHPLTQLGKKHPFCPPLHLHFDQIESFVVLQGKAGSTKGTSVNSISAYEVKDRIFTPEDGIGSVETWVPHTFFPVAGVAEDTIMLMWAHPDGTPETMDRIFFQNLLRYLSDVHEKKMSMDLLQVLLWQDHVATAPVVFPTAAWLGPLRWWVPWKLQAVAAALGAFLGRKTVIKEYTDSADWEALQNGKLKRK